MGKLFHCDVHFHARSLMEAGAKIEHFGDPEHSYLGIVSCHNLADFQTYETLSANTSVNWRLRASVGIHPEFLSLTDLDWCQKLIEQKKVLAIGESGYDFFDGRNQEKEQAQEQAFLAMLDLAMTSRLPLIVHLRKAADCLFRHARRLQGLSGIIIHSTSLAENEIKSLLDKGLPVWFSFGTPVLWAGPRLKKALRAVPLERLLTETDAPCQPVRGKDFTTLDDLLKIEVALTEAKNCDLKDLLTSIHQSCITLGLCHGTF